MTIWLEDDKQYPNIVYYNDDPNRGRKCTASLADALKVTWSMPTTWPELVTELEAGAEFLAFHVDMISKSRHTTTVEFIDAITTMLKFIPSSTNLRIGVIIKPDTPLKTVRTLQKISVQGILLDSNCYTIDEVQKGVNALVNRIPYWPKHILDSLPGAVKKTVAPGIHLTIRQDQVLRLIKERGASNKVIAKALGISESTVKLHVTEVLKKYGVKSRTQLAVFSHAPQDTE